MWPPTDWHHVTAYFGDITALIPMTAGQSIRRSTDDTLFEGYDPAVALTFSQSAVGRSLNSVFVPSSTRDMAVNYSVDVAATLSLTTGQSGTVFLEMSADGSTGWTELARFTNGNSGSLTIGLNLTQTVTGNLGAVIPAGYSVRLRTANNTGSPTFTYRSGSEATTI